MVFLGEHSCGTGCRHGREYDADLQSQPADRKQRETSPDDERQSQQPYKRIHENHRRENVLFVSISHHAADHHHGQSCVAAGNCSDRAVQTVRETNAVHSQNQNHNTQFQGDDTG